MKLAIVTGSSSGLGKAVVDKLLETNWSVLGFARRAAQFSSDRYIHHQIDLGDKESVEQFFTEEWIQGLPKGIEELALVNNAGALGQVEPITATNMTDLALVTQLNFVTPLWLMGFLRRSIPKARFKVVNISSGAAINAYHGWGTYCSTKAALKMASEVMALENHPNTFVYSYAPGVIDTPMQGELRDTNEGSFPSKQKFIDLHREGQLVPAEAPAGEIAEYLNNPVTPGFKIGRYGEQRS